MKTTCEHGTPVSEDCGQCRAVLAHGNLMDQYMTLKAELVKKDAEIERLRGVIAGCPGCSELDRKVREVK